METLRLGSRTKAINATQRPMPIAEKEKCKYLWNKNEIYLAYSILITKIKCQQTPYVNN